MADTATDQITCGRCGNSQPAGIGYCTACGLPMFSRPRGWHPRTWGRWAWWFLLYKVLHVNDTPHRIALGLALGMFTAFTPTIGVQMTLTLLLAWMFRANKVVGLPLAWLTNPFTIAPVFYFNYRIGAAIVGGEPKRMSDFVIENGTWLQQVQNWWSVLVTVFWQCWIGSLIIGAILGIITYVASYYGIVAYRVRHRRRFPASRFENI